MPSSHRRHPVIHGAALLGLLLGLIPEPAPAFSCRVSLLPNGDANGCFTCHESPAGGGPRNPFGKDVDDRAQGCQPFWGPELAQLDSDGDGRTNGEELLDPDGAWEGGQPAPGDPSRVTHPGIVDDPPPEGPLFVRGDANADGRLDVSDPVRTLRFLFLDGASLPCEAAADANGSDDLDVSDAIYGLEFLFTGGGVPPAPWPECGPGSTKLPCESFPPCAG